MRAADALRDLERRAGTGEHAVGGVRAGECLVAEDVILVDVPDRLEGDVDALLQQQRAHGADLVDGDDRTVALLVVERADAAAGALGLVQGGVGLLAQQLGDRGSSSSWATPALILTPRCLGVGLHAGEHLARAASGVCGRMSANSSPPRRNARSPRRPLSSTAGQALEQLVAVAVAARVVLELEVVDVDDRDGEREVARAASATSRSITPW